MAREGRGRPLGQDGGEARAMRPKARQRGAVVRDEAKPQPDSASPGGPVIRMGRMETAAKLSPASSRGAGRARTTTKHWRGRATRSKPDG